MAITMDITGLNQTAGATEEQFFQAPKTTGRCSKLAVYNRSDSGAVLQVRIPELHGATNYANIPVGVKEYFRVYNGELKTAYCKGAGAKLDWYPTEITKGP